MDYKKFKQDFESSGKTQKAFGEERSMSSSMVHYYLRKSRSSYKEQEESSSFKELTIQEVRDREIKITTGSGLQIIIPI